MSDLISRQAAIEKIEAHIRTAQEPYQLDDFDNGVNWGFDTAISIMQNLPSAQPEIIRCKDCRYYEWMSNRIPEEQTWHCHCWNTDTGKDDFCSYAERRTDETD